MTCLSSASVLCREILQSPKTLKLKQAFWKKNIYASHSFPSKLHQELLKVIISVPFLHCDVLCRPHGGGEWPHQGWGEQRCCVSTGTGPSLPSSLPSPGTGSGFLSAHFTACPVFMLLVPAELDRFAARGKERLVKSDLFLGFACLMATPAPFASSHRSRAGTA